MKGEEIGVDARRSSISPYLAIRRRLQYEVNANHPKVPSPSIFHRLKGIMKSLQFESYLDDKRYLSYHLFQKLT